MSGFGDLKYPADFKHFEYVNPTAPKGGLFSQIGSTRQFNQNFLTFNSLNSYIFRGDAALGMELTFATLMKRAGDEPDAMYGLAARAVRISGDGLTYRFLMRPEAKFHDGSRMTAHDVAFSLNLLKEKGHPIITQLMRDVSGVEATDDATVVVRFAAGRGRDVPLFVASLPIFSRAYYAKRNVRRDHAGGAARLRSLQGRQVRGRPLHRIRPGQGLVGRRPAGVGRARTISTSLRYEFYRDRDVAFEGFTGRNYLFREEFTSRIWATRYNFPAIKDGRVKQDVLPDDTPSGAQGWFFNTRRDKFKNRMLREALILAFDFEWTNKSIMYGSYDRTHSVFQNSNMMAAGRPGADELALLEPFRGKVPDEVFGEPFVPPVTDGSGQDRNLLRQASALLAEGRLPHQGRPARDAQRRADHDRVPDRRAVVPAASHAVHQEPRHARHRRQPAHRRSAQYRSACRRLRFRHRRPAVQLFDPAGRLAAQLFHVAGGGDQGLAESCRHRRSGGRRAGRQDHRRRQPAGAGDRLQGARPRHPRRPLLGSTLVQGVALDRLLGRVRTAADQAALRARHPGNLVVRPRSGGEDAANGMKQS